MKRTKRIATLILMTTFVISSFSVSASAASKKYSLPTGIKVYEHSEKSGDAKRGYPTGDWVRCGAIKIKYNKKGDPVRYSGESGYRKGDLKITYQYRDGKYRKKVINNRIDHYKITFSYNKKGHLIKTKNLYTDGAVKVRTNKKGWVQYYYDDWMIEDSGPIHFQYYKNGSPKKMKHPTGVVKFNKNGLMKSYVSTWDFEAELSGTTYAATQFLKYSYKYDKKGRVKSLIVKEKIRFHDYGPNSEYKDSKWHTMKKALFSYSKKHKTSHQRKWAVMIASSVGLPSPYDIASLPYGGFEF